MSDDQEAGFITRRARGVTRYVGRRFGNPFIREVGRESLSRGVTHAKAALMPPKTSREEIELGLQGRYRDGGRERFREMMRMQQVVEQDLAELAANRRRAAIICFLGSAVCLAIGTVLMVQAGSVSEKIFGFVTSFTSITLLAIGIRHDFSRWQIVNRRFGGLREYLGDQGEPAAPLTDKR